MSRRESKRIDVDEVMAEFEAEDGAINHLARLPEPIGKILAVKAATSAGERWKLEQDEMLRCEDQRLVYLSTTDELEWLGEAAAKFSQDPLWQGCSESHLGGLYVKLPPDTAAFISIKVAQYVCRHGRRLWPRP